MNKVTPFIGMIPLDVKLRATMYEATLCPTHEGGLQLTDYPEPCFTKSCSKGVILQSLRRMGIFFLVPMTVFHLEAQ